MATIIQGGPDLRQAAIEQGVSSGVSNFFTARKKRETEQRFLEAFKRVNEATDYETAVKSLADVDSSILSNPQALKLLSEQIDRKFPPRETLDVIDIQTRRPTTVTHPKGRPPSDQELAAQGVGRARSMGVGNFIAISPEGEAQAAENVTRGEVQAAVPSARVFTPEEAAPSAALENAFAARQRAAAAKKKAAGDTATGKRPTQFEETVSATGQRLGLNVADPQQRNKVVSVVTQTDQTRKDLRSFYGKDIAGEIFFTDSTVRPHVAKSEMLIEPGLVKGLSPDQIKNLMVSDIAFSAANDPNATSQHDTAQRDFLQLTGLQAGDANVKAGARAMVTKLAEGQSGTYEVPNAEGKIIREIYYMKLGGRIIPIGSKDVLRE